MRNKDLISPYVVAEVLGKEKSVYEVQVSNVVLGGDEFDVLIAVGTENSYYSDEVRVVQSRGEARSLHTGERSPVATDTAANLVQDLVFIAGA